MVNITLRILTKPSVSKGKGARTTTQPLQRLNTPTPLRHLLVRHGHCPNQPVTPNAPSPRYPPRR